VAFLSFNVSSISNQSFADASTSNITRLALPMPMACQEHLKEKKYHINLSLSLVETGVPGEKPLQAKLRVVSV
jgi:hypothetical protein